MDFFDYFCVPDEAAKHSYPNPSRRHKEALAPNSIGLPQVNTVSFKFDEQLDH